MAVDMPITVTNQQHHHNKKCNDLILNRRLDLPHKAGCDGKITPTKSRAVAVKGKLLDAKFGPAVVQLLSYYVCLDRSIFQGEWFFHVFQICTNVASASVRTHLNTVSVRSHSGCSSARHFPGPFWIPLWLEPPLVTTRPSCFVSEYLSIFSLYPGGRGGSVRRDLWFKELLTIFVLFHTAAGSKGR